MQPGFPAGAGEAGGPAARGLTKTTQDSTFDPFRGHLSRPACSHVKQLAKQAGDVFDPGRTYRSGRVFHGLISVAVSVRPHEVDGQKWLA
jgi:hypothetical protein